MDGKNHFEQWLKDQEERDAQTWLSAEELACYLQIRKPHARVLISKYLPHERRDGEKKVNLLWVEKHERMLERYFLWDLRHGLQDEAFSQPAQRFAEEA